MRRRDVLFGVGAGAGAAALARPSIARAAPGGDLGSARAMIEAARKLSQSAHRSTEVALRPPFDALTYDSYRGVRPRAGAGARLPIGGDFHADLLPPGWLFKEPVAVRLPDGDGPIAFSPDLYDLDARYFDAGALSGAEFGNMGFSGLRIAAPINAPGRLDEVIVFQGASYFRALARDTEYGLSARGLSLGTGGPGPEEFPVTRAISVFEAGKALMLGCLIDSPRAAAALLATLHPGTVDDPATRMRCSLHLFARESLSDAGIAPLTSMFKHNKLGPARMDDFRPAVHDSDVLVIDNGAGERIWRPLANPDALQMSAFADTGPQRFGLVQQRDQFEDFQDAEAAYHRRPTAWVEPLGDWGPGHVQLLEIPTEDEFADNIVAFWRPEAPLAAGLEHRFDYNLIWARPGAEGLTMRHALAQIRSASGVEPNRREGRLFVLDYSAAKGSPPNPEDLVLDVTAPQAGRIEGVSLYRLSAATASMRESLRASFVFIPAEGQRVAELRVALLHRQDRVAAAPVWLYRWTPSRNGGP